MTTIDSKEYGRETRIKKEQLALKLHRQCSRSSYNKLRALISDARIHDPIFLKVSLEVCIGCDICQKHKKTALRSVVDFSLANGFNCPRPVIEFSLANG